MKLKEILSPSFNRIRRPAAASRPLWAERLSAKSSFCRAVVQSGLLTQRQMVHAALSYRLGRSRDDAVIYWQIDHLGVTHDGKLMWYGPDCHRLKHRNATWVSHLLKRHYGVPDDIYQSVHCFFGQHLLAHTEDRAGVRSKMLTHRPVPIESPVAIVEAEKSAIILSEIYPQYIWLAAGGMGELQPYKFAPLRRHKVVLFPDTDPKSIAFTQWYKVAQEVMGAFFWPPDNPIRVSPYLEQHASPDQKQRKIDLVDFIFENR